MMKYAAYILVFIIAVSGFTGCRNAPINAQSETKNSVESPSPTEILKITPTPTPTPAKDEKKSGLVELVKLDGTIKLDIRYATTNNFVGKTIYKEARAFLQKPAADALVRIHQKLKKENLGIVIFDGYRPLSATKLFWEVTPADKKKFVANPKNGSRHNRGCAVDLSLFNLKTGENLDMPTDFDDFTARAAIDYAGATESQKKNRETLRRAMESDGFKVYAAEWWHYDFQNCPENRILDIPFSEINGDKNNEKVVSEKIKLDSDLANLFAQILEQIRQPNFHTDDTVFVSINGFIYELETGKLIESGERLPKRCGNYVDIDQTLLDSKKEGLAGGGALWKFEKGNWKEVAADEGIGYQFDELLKQGVAKSTLKCLGIKPL